MSRVSSTLQQRSQRVEFHNSRGEKLVGTLVDGTSSLTVVLCHGFSDNRNTKLMAAIAEAIDLHQISSFRFDFSGNGESEGDFEFGNYWKEVEDIRGAIKHLRDKNRKIVALIGHSKGGDDVLLYASRYDDIPKVINISGRFDLKRGVTERYGTDIFERLDKTGSIEVPRKLPNGTMMTYRLTKKSMEDRLKVEMGHVVKAIENSQVLTIHGTEDRTIPKENAHQFDDVIPHHTLVLIQGGDHNLTQNGDHTKAVTAAVISFLR